MAFSTRAARLAAESRILSDRAFADLVAGWQRRFAPLALELRPVEVPSRVWTRIRERLGWPLDEPSGSSAARSLSIWRLTAGVAATVALGLLAVDIVPRCNAPTVLRGPARQVGDHAFTRRRLPRLARDRGCAPRYASAGARAERSGRAGTRRRALADTVRSSPAIFRKGLLRPRQHRRGAGDLARGFDQQCRARN